MPFITPKSYIISYNNSKIKAYYQNDNLGKIENIEDFACH